MAKVKNGVKATLVETTPKGYKQTLTSDKPASSNNLNTTAVQAGNTPVKNVTATPAVKDVIAVDTSTNGNSQEGGNGNASTNPYSNAYQTYKTNLGKVKEAQIGQLDTEYNRQKEQIEGAYQGMNRNAYVTYMQRALQNRNAASNMGVNRTGMQENMNTANAVDYNRSVGNLGAYRVNQLSDAENAYNSRLADLNAQYDTQFANADLQGQIADIGRQNELADLQQQQEFTASENAKNREQQALDAQRAYDLQVRQYQDDKNKWNYENYVANTVNRYTSVKQVDNAIKKWQDAKKAGNLNNWQTAYYSQAMAQLRLQKAELQANKK